MRIARSECYIALACASGGCRDVFQVARAELNMREVTSTIGMTRS